MKWKNLTNIKLSKEVGRTKKYIHYDYIYRIQRQAKLIYAADNQDRQ